MIVARSTTAQNKKYFAIGGSVNNLLHEEKWLELVLIHNWKSVGSVPGASPGRVFQTGSAVESSWTYNYEITNTTRG